MLRVYGVQIKVAGRLMTDDLPDCTFPVPIAFPQPTYCKRRNFLPY